MLLDMTIFHVLNAQFINAIRKIDFLWIKTDYMVPRVIIIISQRLEQETCFVLILYFFKEFEKIDILG